MDKTEGKQFRLVSYNIHRGLSPFRLKDVQDNIASVLEDSRADILCLQEDLSHNLYDVSHLVDRCSSIWQHNVYGETVVAAQGSQGNSIFTRYPILETRNLDISADGPARGEPRRMLGAHILIGRRMSIWVYCTHFGLTSWQRQQNYNLLTSHLRAHHAFKRGYEEPLIIAGDFNDWRCQLSALFKESLFLKEAFYALHGRHARTFPTFLPLVPLDRIYFKGLTPLSCQVLAIANPTPHSDHVPIACDFLASF